MGIDTKELINRIKQEEDIEVFLEKYEDEMIALKPVEFLNELAEEKCLSPAQIARDSGQSDYVYKVFKGERKPSRDVLIAISFGMKFDIEEAQLLLRMSKMAALDPRDRRDSVILFALKEGYGIDRTNELLNDMKERII
ncbi:MAG: hypothetical protein Q4B67_07635 [Eubacteriales bacterium]|nr:hypothetical protein [Eubacteriales bacterium]